MDYTSQTDVLSVARRLVEVVRLETDASFDRSQRTVELILAIIAEHMKCDKTEMQQLIGHVESNDVLDVPNCSDTLRLKAAFEQISAGVGDQQQRGWTLHDDQEQILQELATIRSIVKLSDRSSPLFVLRSEDYQQPISLVSFFELEQRSILRLALCHTIDSLARFDLSVVQALLPSMLPIDLINVLSGSVIQETEFNRCVLSTLTALLCSDEGLPFGHYDMLNTAFCAHLLQETNANTWCAQQCGVLLLAIALQFRDADENTVVQLMCKQTDKCRHFVEQIMLIVNRDDDPVWPYDEMASPYTSSSCHLLQHLLLVSPDISTLIYSNDAPILLDVLLRRCVDLSDGRHRDTFLLLLVTLLEKMPELRDDSEVKRYVEDNEGDTSEIMQRMRAMVNQ